MEHLKQSIINKNVGAVIETYKQLKKPQLRDVQIVLEFLLAQNEIAAAKEVAAQVFPNNY